MTTVELMTPDEVANRLGVVVSRLSRGWGPPALPQYRRPRRWSRNTVEKWLCDQEGAAWDSTSDVIAPETHKSVVTIPGGVGSNQTDDPIKSPAARSVSERLRSRSRDIGQKSGLRHLVAVPKGA